MSNPQASSSTNTPQATTCGAKPLLIYLQELRKRLLISVAVILGLFLLLYPFAKPLYSNLAAPLLANLPQGQTLIATQVIAPFLAPLKLTFAIALFLAMPLVLYQLWLFIGPGLYKRERRLIVPLVLSSIVLFYLGTAFAYFIASPLIFHFLTTMAPNSVNVTPDISAYLSFTLKLFFAFGLAFEVPVVTLGLIWSGVVKRQSLAQKRPYIIVILFIISMLLTPPDVISQILLAVPLWLLFELGLLLAKFLTD